MATKPENHMVLTLFMMTTGYYKDSWRLEGSRSEELGYLDFATELALMGESAKLDAVFYADLLTAQPIFDADLNFTALYEPITTLSALAARTKNIGLIGTVSTTFSLPYQTARQMSGLDTLSGGRAGWNVVTSWMGNENFGLDEMPTPADRYRRAAEYVDVVTKLWDSWSDDAVINDRESGWWADPEKIRAIDHVGEFFKVKGPLNMRRSPQGRPVLVQAGSSGPGMDLGSSVADVIYSAQPRREAAIEFYAEYKEKVRAKGRDPRSVKILPGIVPIIGDTQAEAEEIAQDLANHVNFKMAIKQMKRDFNIDLSHIDLDDKIPAEALPDNPMAYSRYDRLKHRALVDGFTLREVLVENARSTTHLWAAGTASSIADMMVDWFDSNACDGFSLNTPYMHDGLRRICDGLVPELRERGYFRTEYEGETLRDNLGLDHHPGT